MIPLVLVPGLMCDRAVWQAVLPALSTCARCQVVDHGEAESLTQMAAQVLAQAPQRFAVAGHSMGGRVALEVMRLAPERVTHLGLFDTGYLARAMGEAGEEEARKRHLLLDVARTQGVRAMALQWVQGMVAPQRLCDAALIEEVVSMFERQSADMFACQIRALLARPDATPVLRRVQVPTLVLCGEQDSWSPLAQHQAMADLMPVHPAVTCIAESGHMSMMERPQAVAQAMMDWLAQ